jgi:monofunctional biosynthetic peptidoglycan transglycosylase
MTFRSRRKKRARARVSWFRRLLRWVGLILLTLIIADAAYLALIWPDWESYRQGPIQRSQFILGYERESQRRDDWPELQWRPVAINKIPKHLIRAVIVAEDSRFYQHEGVDLQALKEAMEYNLSQGRMAYGASTLSQQTTKNLFLSLSRNPLRKWHELVLTFSMERNLSKRRILEYYLNVAEFGRGIYGVDAAARYYWDVPVSRINARESIELAATLPSPVANNPRSDTRAFRKRVAKIRRNFYR